MPLSDAAHIRETALLRYATDSSQQTAEIPLEEGWSILKNDGVLVLVDVLRGVGSSKPFGNKGYVALYTISYRMCSNAGSHDHSKALYDRARGEVEHVLRTHVLPDLVALTTNRGGPGGAYLLRRFALHWSNQQVLVKWVQQLFRHLDNGYVANSGAATMTSVGLKLFYDLVFAPFALDLQTALVDVIEQDRDGVAIDAALVRACVSAFPAMGLCSKARDLKTVNCALSAEADLSVYQRDFEGALLERTTMYYARRSAEWLVLETRDYLAKVEGALAGEVDRCREYLHASSESKMLKVIEHELLQRHVCALVDRDVGGMHALLLADRDDDLKRMCKMFKNVPEGLAVMAVSFKKFVQMRGHAVLEARAEAVQLAKAAAAKEKSAAEDSAVRDDSGEAALHTGGQKAHKTADGAVLIQGFLALHSKMKAKVADLFLGEGAFRRALKEALQDVLNCDAATDATNVELLVGHTDRVLGGKVKLGEADLEALSSDLFQLFRFFADKDLYAELYREALAKRLLSRRCASVCAEKAFIVRLKTEQGAPFTAKLEGMVNDFTLGEDLERQWKARSSAAGAGASRIDFSVQVLTQGFWPAQKPRDVGLPRDMVAARGAFDAWYREKHGHRVLAWIYALGEATVKGTFGGRAYDMAMSTFQAAALVQFSGRATDAGVGEICEAINVDVPTAKRVLHSLACGRHRVLAKTGSPRTVAREDVFRGAADFSSKLRRFAIQMSTLDGDAKKKVDVEVQASRTFNIDATLVRIMKARKRLAHQELVGEVIHQIQHFKPEPRLVRQRIEGLIEREYLERDDDDAKVYTYLP